MSVDMPDPHPDYVPEDLTINDQESFVELILEKFLGMGNVIEEHEDADAPLQHFEISKEFTVGTTAYPEITFIRPYIELNIKNPYNETYVSKYVSEINPPLLKYNYSSIFNFMVKL